MVLNLYFFLRIVFSYNLHTSDLFIIHLLFHVLFYFSCTCMWVVIVPKIKQKKNINKNDKIIIKIIKNNKNYENNKK